MRGSARLLLVALAATALAACGAVRTMASSPDDLADYRAFRVAAAEGTRLARAQVYLARHPKGVFAEEVRQAYDDEEPRYFEAAQSSREAVRRYLADLPDGPHAEAARALLLALGQSIEEAELRDVARRVRYNEAKLETAAVQRRAVGEAILGAVGVLLDERVYGVPRTDGPRELRELLLGRTATTWGAVPARREEDLFFLLPTRPDRESRLLTLAVGVREEGGRVVSGYVEGSDAFVRWTEADQIVKLDPDSLDDRTEAQVHAMERLGGALERRFPQSSCPDKRRGAELYHRTCDGWEVVVSAGSTVGAMDSIVVRGSGRKAEAR